jgi:DNA repair protein RadC
MPETATITYTPLIRDMPLAERPRERLKHYGADHLNNTELLAILLRTGREGESVIQLASRLLARFNGLPGLAKAGFQELRDEKGVGEAKACQVLAALVLGRRLSSLQPEDRPLVRTPSDAANLLVGELSLLEQEHLRVILLNTRNQVMGIQEIYVGNVNSSVVRIAEVLRPAIRENCPAIIVAHNHPSGDPTPSREDITLTEQLAAAARLMDIELLDHLVIGRGDPGFISLKEKGLGFKER